MAQGEAAYERFWLIREDPFPSIPVVDVPQVRVCCNESMLLALGDTTSSDPLKNDVYGPIWQLPPVANGATMILIKDGENVANLTTGKLIPSGASVALGTLYDFAFFTNVDGKPFVGYQLKWKNVLEELGPGKYKIEMTVTFSIGGGGTVYTPDFCLYQYTPNIANGTVRIEYNRSGIIGDPDFDSQIIDLGELDWYNSYRLLGDFGRPQFKYEGTYVQYNSGERKYVSLVVEPEFTLFLKPQPHFVHNIIAKEIMTADRIFITDYNSINAVNYVLKGVYDGTYEINDEFHMQTKFHSAEAKFKQRTNNLRKRRQ